MTIEALTEILRLAAEGCMIFMTIYQAIRIANLEKKLHDYEEFVS